MTSIVCPGSQNDVSVYKNLLFVSVEATRAKKDCTTHAGTRDATNALPRHPHLRHLEHQQPGPARGVQTCRGSHTHTLVRPKNDPNNVYIYVSGTAGVRAATELAGCDQRHRPGEPANPSLWRIDVIKVPLAAPKNAAVVDSPRLFKNEATGAINGLQNGPTQTRARHAVARHRHDATGRRTRTSATTSRSTRQIDLAAGACAGNGLLIDISDPANPKRIDAVADPLFAYWHGATFSNDGKAVLFTDEWGGGSGARCRATDQLSWGADAIYEIVNKKLVFRSYYKLPVAQTVAARTASRTSATSSRSPAGTSWSRPGTRAAPR